MSVDKLNSLRGCSQPQLAGTYQWVWGFLPKELRADFFAAYDPKAVLWARRFEASEAEWTSFAEKVKRRKGKCSEGADEHYVHGVSLADVSALARQRVLHSEPVLPGGMQIQQTAAAQPSQGSITAGGHQGEECRVIEGQLERGLWN